VTETLISFSSNHAVAPSQLLTAKPSKDSHLAFTAARVGGVPLAVLSAIRLGGDDRSKGENGDGEEAHDGLWFDLKGGIVLND
jgi:hypothetical protein